MLERLLFPLPVCSTQPIQVRSNVDRIEEGLERLRICAPYLLHGQALSEAAGAAEHPLAKAALERYGPANHRAGTASLEQSAAARVCQETLNSLAKGNVEGLVGALLIAARLSGCPSAKVRVESSRLKTDRDGHVIGFPPSFNIQSRLNELVSYYGNKSEPTSFRAIVMQAAWLNLHPFTDGNGRSSRVLVNLLFWNVGVGKGRFLPLHDMRITYSYSYEIALRSVEIHGSWLALTEFYASLIEAYANAAAKA